MEEIKAIGFTDKEYAKSLESLINNDIDSLLDMMRASFEARDCVVLKNNYVLSFTTNNAVRKYFIYASDIDEEQPQKSDVLKNALGNRWLGNWPNEDQIKLISKTTYNPGDFIFSENETGNCSVLTLNDSNSWIKDDFNQRPARPVSVKNISENESKAVLFYLLKNGFIPEFENDSIQTEVISDVVLKLKNFDSTVRKITITPEDLDNINPSKEMDEIIKRKLLSSLELNPGFTASDVKNYLKKSDFIRCQLPTYDEGYFSDETQWLWELWPEAGVKHKIEIPSGDIKIRARDPHEDINKNSVIAIDFGTSSTVVVEYDPRHPNEPRQICVGSQEDGKFENPTLMLVKKYGEFLSHYYSKDCRPYTKWDDLMVSHAVKDRMGNAENNEFKAVVSHIKQWAADPDANLSIKPAEESEPITLKPLKELLSDDNEEFNPIEIYAYFLGLYLNNRQEGYGIYLNYQLSYPATYNDDVRDYICQSFKKGIRKSIPAAINDDEIRVEMKTSEPEAYAVTALKKYGFEPKDGEKIKYAIFDFGGGTSDFAYGYWTRPDAGQFNKEWKIKTLHVHGEPHLGGENILDGLAFKVFSDPRNLAQLRQKDEATGTERIFKFAYGIEKKQRNAGVDTRFISKNFYARNNMATLIDWTTAAEVDEHGNFELNEGTYFPRGLREFWENQEKYFNDRFTGVQKSNDGLILINQIKIMLEKVRDEKLKQQLEEQLKKATETDNPLDRKSIEASLLYLENQNKADFDNASINIQDEYKIQPRLYYQTEDVCDSDTVDIIVSKQMMYKYFSDEINEGINSFFNELKTAFKNTKEDGDLYNGNIKIFLGGNASKSPILQKLMKERIKKETNDDVSFELFNRFDADDYYEKLEKVMRDQEWGDEEIDAVLKDQRSKNPKFQPTGKTGVAFGIIEMIKGKIQVVQREEQYFKYYLGNSEHIRGIDRFVPFIGFKGQKPVYPNGDWVETFILPESSVPQTVNLYYTTKGVDSGKQSIDIASSYPLTIPAVGKNEKIYIKAAGIDKIFCISAIDENDAELKLSKETKDVSITLK